VTEPDPIDELAAGAEEDLEEGEYEAALEGFEAALRLDPEHWGAALGRAECLHLLWRTRDALRAVLALTPPSDEFDDPDRAYLEAEIREGLGEMEIADRLFEAAHEQDPDNFPLPTRLGEADFRGLLEKVLASLPGVIREAVLEVPVLVHSKPTPEIAEREPAIHPEVLGLFVGTPVGDKARGGSGYGDVVMLFQRNLERAGRNRQEVTREIKITLLHEYGHYLGFDEEELEHLGLG
jgi:predicted Zn-dependent protease with MMP-like domain